MIRNSLGNRLALGVAALILILPYSGVASAAVVGGLVTGGSSGGSFQLISPPTAIGPDSLDSPNVFAFDELQDVVLTDPLQIGPNRVAGVGSIVSSHYIAFDPATTSTAFVEIEFDDRIAALIRSPTLETTTDLLGIDSTDYTYVPNLNTERTDEVMVDPANPNRLLVRFGANSPGDHLRVLTGRILPVPEPASLLLLAVAATSLTLRRHRIV